MFSFQRLFVIWLVLAPFVVVNRAFEGAKVVWFLAGGFFISIYWIFSARKLVSIVTSPDYWYLGWLGVLLTSSLLGVHPVDSVLGGKLSSSGRAFFPRLVVSDEVN